MFDQDGLGNYGTDAAWTRKSGNGRDEMDEKDQEIAHCRIVARKPKTRGIQDKLAIRHGQAGPPRRLNDSVRFSLMLWSHLCNRKEAFVMKSTSINYLCN